MEFDPDIHHRRSIRLKGYDYSSRGLYFVTICTHEKQCLFGACTHGKLRLNDAGRAVSEVWLNSEAVIPGVHLDAFIVMPNHLHGIVFLPGNEPEPSPSSDPLVAEEKGEPPAEKRSPKLGRVIRSFKTVMMRRYASGVRDRGWPAYAGKLWQRNYYEHIIRNEKEWNSIRTYIRDNPRRWEG